MRSGPTRTISGAPTNKLTFESSSSLTAILGPPRVAVVLSGNGRGLASARQPSPPRNDRSGLRQLRPRGRRKKFRKNAAGTTALLPGCVNSHAAIRLPNQKCAGCSGWAAGASFLYRSHSAFGSSRSGLTASLLRSRIDCRTKKAPAANRGRCCYDDGLLPTGSAQAARDEKRLAGHPR